MEPRRRVVAGLTVAAVTLIVAGIAAVAIDSGFYAGGVSSASRSHTGSQPSTDSIATPTPSAAVPTPSGRPDQSPPVATPSPSPVASQTARPSGFAMRGASLVYYAADGTVVPVQPIAGLRAALVEGRALYYALAANRYGLKTGSYAGEFDPNVTMQQADGSSAQTGGIVLVGPAANRLIADNLASISAPAQRWLIRRSQGHAEPRATGGCRCYSRGWQHRNFLTNRRCSRCRGYRLGRCYLWRIRCW